MRRSQLIEFLNQAAPAEEDPEVVLDPAPLIPKPVSVSSGYAHEGVIHLSGKAARPAATATATILRNGVVVEDPSP